MTSECQRIPGALPGERHLIELRWAQVCVTGSCVKGFQLKKYWYQISDEITRAIKNFSVPLSYMDLQPFFGLVNQLSRSTNTITEATAKLKPLLSSKNDFNWEESQNQTAALEDAKRIFPQAPMLTFYDMTLDTRLVTDVSLTGIGFILQQKHGDVRKMVKARSRFITDTETRHLHISGVWNFPSSTNISVNYEYFSKVRNFRTLRKNSDFTKKFILYDFHTLPKNSYFTEIFILHWKFCTLPKNSYTRSEYGSIVSSIDQIRI